MALLISAVLTAAYLLTIVIRGCFPGEEEAVGEKCEVSWKMLLPMGVYAALIVGLGIFSGPVIQMLEALAGMLM